MGYEWAHLGQRLLPGNWAVAEVVCTQQPYYLMGRSILFNVCPEKDVVGQKETCVGPWSDSTDDTEMISPTFGRP